MDRAQNNLCLILRDKLSLECKQDIEKKSADEWNSLCRIAADNNLLPLLYYKLISHKIAIPRPMENSLRNDYLGCSGKDLKRKHQLCEVIKIFNELYRPIVNKGAAFVSCSRRAAELIKYASNAFLATKISFINEIANFF